MALKYRCKEGGKEKVPDNLIPLGLRKNAPDQLVLKVEGQGKVFPVTLSPKKRIPVDGNLVPRLHEIKLISSSKTRYTIHREGQEAMRAVDKRAGELNSEYLAKAKQTDLAYCGTARGEVGPVERKLGSLGRVHGIVIGAFGEASDDLHSLLHHLAVSRVRYAGPQVGRRGQMRTEDAEIALTTSFLRKSLSVCAVRSAARLLLGRLEVIGPGGAAAALRRNNALQLERRWANQRRADALSILQGRSILRRGHFRVD